MNDGKTHFLVDLFENHPIVISIIFPLIILFFDLLLVSNLFFNSFNLLEIVLFIVLIGLALFSAILALNAVWFRKVNLLSFALIVTSVVLVLIVVFGTGYWITMEKLNIGYLTFNGEDLRVYTADQIEIFLTCVYFSGSTFFTLGYGDISPFGFHRFISILEAFTGLMTTLIIVAEGIHRTKVMNFFERIVEKEGTGNADVRQLVIEEMLPKRKKRVKKRKLKNTI